MQRLHPFPAPSSSPARGTPTLVVVEEDFHLPVAPPVHAEKPARPLRPALNLSMPSPANKVTARSANEADDPFEDELHVSSRRELDFGPRSGNLPRFVPLHQESLITNRDPWSIHSPADLFRLYLPEISISFAAIACSGLLAGQLTHHFIHAIPAKWVLGAYLGLYLINLSSLYFGAKDKASPQVKERLRSMLLGSLLFFFPHMLGMAILKAAA